nr:hypothetical protein [Tanacetum cinerariifolium]
TTDKSAKAKRIKRSVSRKTRQYRSSPKSVGESEAEEVPAEEPQIADEVADFQKAVEEKVPGKGKAKVSEEQVAHDLLSLQKHKKTSPADQYIFQRRVSEPTASSFHDVSPYDIYGQSVSEDESEKIVLGDKKGGQDEGQAGPDPNAQTEGQMGSNTGQAGPDPGNAEARGQSTSSHVVHAQTGSDTGAQAEGQAGSNPDETSEG